MESTRPPIPPKPKSKDRSKIASLPLSRKDCQLSEVEKIRNDEEHSSFIRGQSSLPTVPFNEKTRRIPPPVSPKPLKQDRSKPLPTSPAASGGDQNFDVTPPLIHPIPMKSDSPTTKSKRLPVHNEIKQPYNYGRQSPNHTKQPPLPPQTQQPPPQTQQSPLQTQQPPLQTQQSPLQAQQSPLQTQQSENRKSLEFETVSKPMTIATVILHHGTSLPVLLKVSQGYASFLDKYSFGKDQLFVALEKKEIDLATVRDPGTNQLHELPLDEELLLSPVLPDCFTEEGIPSLLSARELLGCSTLPRTFCAMKRFKDSKGHLVEQGTLLFTLKEGNPLVAITQGNVKICIDKSTIGEFSVRSSNTKVSLKEAVKYLKFPFTCRLFPAKGVDCFVNKIIVEKISKGVVIEGVMKTEEGHSVTSFQKPSIIPASSQIQVNIMNTRAQEMLESIYDYATKIYTSLKLPSQPHIQEYKPLISDDINSDASDRKGPHHSRRRTTAISSRSSSLPRIPQSAEFQARSFTYPNPTAKPVGRVPVARERQCDKAKAILGSANVPMNQVDPDPKSGLNESPPGPLSEGGDLESDSNYVDMSGGGFDDTSRHKNIQALKKMTVNDVLLLLEKMNLNQYRDTFEEEHIDGILLASLDNEMLEELGVTKSLHKLRLNKIIEGVQSVEKGFL